MYILFAILSIGIMILVHEVGHFLVARAVGMPVYELAVGFGPRLLKKEHKGVLYSLRAIPLGGFVSFGDTDKEDDLKNYYGVPVWKRALVSVAGSLTNILFALVVAFFLLWGSGVATLSSQIETVNADSPAQAAGLQAGDTILAIDDVPVADDPTRISQTIAALQGAPFTVTVQRAQEVLQLPLTPVYSAEDGRYMIGITLQTQTQRMGAGQAAKQAVLAVGEMFTEIIRLLRRLITRGEGADEMVGVVGAVDTMATYGRTYGFAAFLSLVVSISVNLGIMNLMPIPGLDGAKLLFLAIEAVRGKPIAPEKEGVVQLIGLGLMVILFVVVTYRDIMTLITGG